MNTKLKKIKSISLDYENAHSIANSLSIKHDTIIEVDNFKRFRKYIYELGLKCKPQRRFRTMKINGYSLKIIRVE